jgi:hypothetical protein
VSIYLTKLKNYYIFNPKKIVTFLSEIWVEPGIWENLKLDQGYGVPKSPDPDQQQLPSYGSIIRFFISFIRLQGHPKL